MSASGRGRLPTCEVRIRRSLRFIVSPPSRARSSRPPQDIARNTWPKFPVVPANGPPEARLRLELPIAPYTGLSRYRENAPPSLETDSFERDRGSNPSPSSEESGTNYPAARGGSAFCPPECRHLSVKIPFERACSRGTRMCRDVIVQRPGDCDADTRPIHHLDRYGLAGRQPSRAHHRSGAQGVWPGAEYGPGPRRSYRRRPAVPPTGPSPWPRSDRDLVARCRGRLRRIAHCPRRDWALAAFPEIAVNHGGSLCRSGRRY